VHIGLWGYIRLESVNPGRIRRERNEARQCSVAMQVGPNNKITGRGFLAYISYMLSASTGTPSHFAAATRSVNKATSSAE